MSTPTIIFIVMLSVLVALIIACLIVKKVKNKSSFANIVKSPFAFF